MRSITGTLTSFAVLALLCTVPGSPLAQEEGAGEQADATTGALDELVAAYEALAGMLGQSSDEAVDRVQSDFENLGDWEYQIVEMANDSTDAMTEELNALGDERWEVFWIEPAPGGLRVYLKRPSVSYLSRVPLTTLLRLLAIGA